jgi:hypothetical protein
MRPADGGVVPSRFPGTVGVIASLPHAGCVGCDGSAGGRVEPGGDGRREDRGEHAGAVPGGPVAEPPGDARVRPGPGGPGALLDSPADAGDPDEFREGDRDR